MKQTPRQRHVAEESGRGRTMPFHDGKVLESSGATSANSMEERRIPKYIYIYIYIYIHTYIYTFVCLLVNLGIESSLI